VSSSALDEDRVVSELRLKVLVSLTRCGLLIPLQGLLLLLLLMVLP
jgi:hypothetical protein